MADRGALVGSLPAVRVGPFRVLREGLLYGAALGAIALAARRFLGPAWSVPLFALAGFVVAFFRDPDRAVPTDPDLAVAPADGTVTAVETSPIGTRISIFLSVFDVHVNRAPTDGRVVAVDYRAGKFGNAMRASSAEQNERNVVRLETAAGDVVLTQIAGLLARRIVFCPRIGERVRRGQRVGMIKFGSRTDVLLPPAARPLVRVGQHVAGGTSAIARLGP